MIIVDENNVGIYSQLLQMPIKVSKPKSVYSMNQFGV